MLHFGAAQAKRFGPVSLTLTAVEGARFAAMLGEASIIPVHYEGWTHLTEGRDEIEQAFLAAGREQQLRFLRETHQRKSNKQEREEIMITREDYQLPPKEGFVLTHFLTVADVKRSAEFYLRILGGTVVRSGEPTIIQIANSWLILNLGGGPTDDKPNVTLRPPQNPNEVSSFLNIRVADIRASYEEWRRRGAAFLTEPKDHGSEIRCYMRDPDDYIIEVGQTTGPQA